MLIVGLVIGPLAGIFAGDILFRSRAVHPAIAAALVGFAFIFLVAAQFLDQELRVGFAAGLMLGLLLAASPMDISVRDLGNH
jgi:hypothetical protein